MKEPTRRPSLAQQKELDKTYGQRMDQIPRQDPNLKPDLIEVTESEEDYDRKVAVIIGKAFKYFEELSYFLNEANFLEGDFKELDLRWGALKKEIEEIDSNKINDYDGFFTQIMDLITKIDEITTTNIQPHEEVQKRLLDLSRTLSTALEDEEDDD